MKNLMTLIFAGALLASCEFNKGQLSDSGTAEQNPPRPRNYSGAELTIGRNICTALAYKRDKMAKLENNSEKFRFNMESKTCTSSQSMNKIFDATIENVGINLQYIPTTIVGNTYFKDVITDQSNVIQTLCENLSASNTVSNVFAVNSSYYTLNLMVMNGFETIELRKQTKNGSGAFPLISIESISILTPVSQTQAKFAGIEIERTLNTSCVNTLNSFATTKQTWKSTLTNYELSE
ncbi:MAG: hypothetical protein K2Q18_08020 [Bdellovibrionales bacterium]|nr:hypothetical protein [Bdellovibrionales bacterium]